MTQVTFKANNGVTLSVTLDDSSPFLSDGVNVFEVDDRPKRTSITRFTGRLPFKQDIAVLFDDFMGGSSQENAISKLEKLAGQPNRITLSGQALRKDLDWVIEGVDWDSQDTIWKSQGGHPVRTRQHAVVHLLEFVKDPLLETPAQPNTSSKKKKSPTKKVKIAKGMMLKQIAVIEYHNPDKWKQIVKANPILFGDGPRTIVPAGITLTIVDGRDQTFTVP